MKFWSKLFAKKETAPNQSDDKDSPFKKKYLLFEELLANTASAQAIINDLEKKLVCHSQLDSQELDQAFNTLIYKIRSILANLNLIGNNKYLSLQERLEQIITSQKDFLKDSLENNRPTGSYKKLFDLIIPLNLSDREEQNFPSGSCKTLQDIIRFSQEMARQEMSKLNEVAFKQLSNARKLVAGIPLHIYLIDFGGGIEGNPKHLYPQHISSIPFRAFLNGLIAMKWPEPPPIDMGGFLGMIGHTLTIPEEEILQTGESSFSFISREYMNCAIRLGYHFSSVEAYAGNYLNNNYIRIFFKGGGAVIERRMRRVRLLTEILKKIGFEKIKINEDAIDAHLTQQDKLRIEKKLEILGKLTAYTKQQDMAMYNEAVTDFYIKEFLTQHFSN